MAFLNDRRIEAAFAFSDPVRASGEFLPELVGQVGLSPHYNRRVVHSVLGIKPYRIEAALKLGYAYRELLFTDTPIIQVSQQAGFAFQSAFSRAFKDYFENTPREIRAQGQANAFRKPSLPGLLASRVVSVPEVPVLRRVYVKLQDANGIDDMSAGDMDFIRDAVLKLTQAERSATIFASAFYLPSRCCVNDISLIAVAPETVDHSPILNRHFARDGIYTRIFRDETYLQLQFEPSEPHSFDDVKEHVAQWVRNQRSYTIGRKLWIERRHFEGGRQEMGELFIPLEKV